VLTTGVGTTGNSRCAVTFAVPYAVRPMCSIGAESNAAAYSVTATAFNMMGPLDSSRYDVVCIAQPNGG
jgi:hypothetical protein